MGIFVMPLTCGCNKDRHCNQHSRQEWENWLEGIAESYAERY